MGQGRASGPQPFNNNVNRVVKFDIYLTVLWMGGSQEERQLLSHVRFSSFDSRVHVWREGAGGGEEISTRTFFK